MLGDGFLPFRSRPYGHAKHLKPETMIDKSANRRSSLLTCEVLDRSRVLDTLVNNLEGMAYRCRNDASWTMIFVSQGSLGLCGYSAAALVDDAEVSWEQITHPDDRARVRRSIDGAIAALGRFTVHYRIRTAAGFIKWVIERGVAVPDEQGEIVVEGFIEDITAQRAVLEALEQAELRYRSIFENASEGIFQSTRDGRYLAANPALARIYGYDSASELVADLADIERRLYVQPGRREAFCQLMEQHGEVLNFESEVYRRDCTRIWISENAHVVRGPNGEFICYEGTVQDISERKHYQQQLERQANHDLLTGLPNRILLNDRIEQGLARAARLGYYLTLVFIDLDNFKQVNDRHGHDAGDALLRLFAQRAQTLLERHRQQHPHTYSAFARLSGDEFAILLLSDAEPGLDALCDALLGLCRGGFRLEERTYPVSLSIGTACYPDDADSITQLLTRADTAMYQAKAEGKCMAVAFSNELEQRNERIRLIEDQLRALDGDDQLRLVYMPALNRDGAVVSCEVLLRWHSPVLGTVSPAEFIPIAERAGLFPKIDSWVIDHALAEYPQLVRLFGEQVILAINVSSAQLADDRICRYLAERAAHHGVAPGRIEIELTETYAAELNKDTMAVVQAIRRAGFRVAIDDFGVGYTSIQQLLEYPADTIKLDMAIITRLTRPDMQHSLSALVAFCHAQGKRVNAEGVDDMEKQSALLQAGCDLFQGYLISPPRALPALEDWMAVRNRAQGALRLEQLAPRVVPQPL